MLGSIAGLEAVADYNVGFAMLFGLYILPSVTFQKYLLPRIHRWYETRNARFLDVLRIGSATMLVLGVLICGGLAYVLPTIIPALFGSRYESAIPLATLLLFAVPFRYVSLCFGALLSTGDFVKTKVVCQGVTVALNVVLNVILIRGHGATGAAIATVTSEAVLAVFFLSSLHTFVRRVSWDSSPQFPIRENHNAAQ
jgi:O-antigen/teichoic acid export membrane protein